MKLNISSALLIVSLAWTQISLHAESKNNVENVERIAATVAILPSLEELLITNAVPSSKQLHVLDQIQPIGDLAEYVYNITSASLENGTPIMDCKVLIDTINASKRNKNAFTKEVAQDVLVNLILAGSSLAAQKALAKEIGKKMSKDEQRVLRRSVRAMALAITQAFFDVMSQAYNERAKDIKGTCNDFIAAVFDNLLQNGRNEFLGEMVSNMLNEKSPSEILLTSYKELKDSIVN